MLYGTAHRPGQRKPSLDLDQPPISSELSGFGMSIDADLQQSQVLLTIYFKVTSNTYI